MCSFSIRSWAEGERKLGCRRAGRGPLAGAEHWPGPGPEAGQEAGEGRRAVLG